MPSVAVTATASAYRRHRPEQTTLFAIVAEHYPRFIEAIEASGGRLPAFVRQEFEDYLKCGLLEHGFPGPARDHRLQLLPIEVLQAHRFCEFELLWSSGLSR